MIVALRYVDKEGGYWEVRTKDAITQHTSLRQFQEQEKIAILANYALQEPGVWIEVGKGKEQEPGE